MSMLHLVCERCGFQVFVETRFQATGWHFKTTDSASLCPACVADLKRVIRGIDDRWRLDALAALDEYHS